METLKQLLNQLINLLPLIAKKVFVIIESLISWIGDNLGDVFKLFIHLLVQIFDLIIEFISKIFS